MRALLVVTAALAMVLATTGPAAAAKKKTRHVLVVANNWDGTADVIDPKRYKGKIQITRPLLGEPKLLSTLRVGHLRDIPRIGSQPERLRF